MKIKMGSSKSNSPDSVGGHPSKHSMKLQVFGTIDQLEIGCIHRSATDSSKC